MWFGRQRVRQPFAASDWKSIEPGHFCCRIWPKLRFHFSPHWFDNSSDDCTPFSIGNFHGKLPPPNYAKATTLRFTLINASENVFNKSEKFSYLCPFFPFAFSFSFVRGSLSLCIARKVHFIYIFSLKHIKSPAHRSTIFPLNTWSRTSLSLGARRFSISHNVIRRRRDE